MIRTPSRIDWTRVICECARVAGSRRKLAALVGKSPTGINELASGRTACPVFDTGIRLLAYYSKHVEHVPGARELAERVKP